MGDAYYCDDYEAIHGHKPGERPVETKVITAPETPDPTASGVPVETKAKGK